jgi:phosphate transport system substrate-binding protein
VNSLVAIFLALSVLLWPVSALAKGVELLGAGATFPYPLYSKMFYYYWRETGIKVNYQPIGSGGGIRQLVNRTVDFGGSDAFMSDEALASAPGEILHIPTCLGAVVLCYNLPGDPKLRFTPKVIADIFLGNIERWNDRRIEEINPGIGLPEMDIMVVHRSDGSGTTFVFTDYLAKVSKAWNEKMGRGKAVNWPVGLGAKGNAGVTGLIKHLPGAVGYTELGYALLNKMPVALVMNKYGRFIKPTTASTSRAAVVPLPRDTRVSITNAGSADGYPISSFTWILVYREQAYKKRSMEKPMEVAQLLWWMTHEAQRYTEPLYYGSLPEEAIGKAENIIKAITYNGRPILR